MICRWCGNPAGEVNGTTFRCARCNQFSEVPAAPPPPPTMAQRAGMSDARFLFNVIGGVVLVIFLLGMIGMCGRGV